MRLRGDRRDGAALQGARLGDGAVIAVGALVHTRTVVPGEFFVPPHTVALDAPVRVVALGDPGLPDAVARVGFAQAAFGVDGQSTDRIRRHEAIAEARVAEARVAEFGAHVDDETVGPEGLEPPTSTV